MYKSVLRFDKRIVLSPPSKGKSNLVKIFRATFRKEKLSKIFKVR